MSPTSVLVLVGSAVDDFNADLSRVYAGGFLDAFAGNPAYSLRIAFVSPDGCWRFPESLESSSIAAAKPISLSHAISEISSRHIDVVVPQMFCRPGMTTYRSLFELLGVPYVGNRPEVMAMTAEKNIARAIVAAAGVAVPDGVLVSRGDLTKTESSRAMVPVVVKPVDSDNSMGVTLVRDPRELAAAVNEALQYSQSALIESYIELGREVRCGIIVRDGDLVCLPLEEYAVDEVSNPIRGRADKLDRTDDGELYLVAKEATRAWIVDSDDPITEKVFDAARACHVALGCRQYSLFDFRIDRDGNPWFLEAGLYCSYSPSSVIAVMAAAAGIPLDELFALAIEEGNR
ncbi:ATP-grasp domain-containing protein [Rhodococcus sp. PAMC28707]|uniref:D-alanine--D-alanine ligase family protein n=1 Tax=unclassified Rhodococcus (in: high G+C Gram-positive bacteria) TaxID=192944 RepID=UPI00109E292D|nr:MULTISPECIES: ATP-grasp domain-containing protein [unclassified Rhodococcus (in: high G+C Gram-positive bacteria)]QCB50065.1 ATP-grasp domain-containing protein [Rhodococcus sp. PAMC28705]QCB58240.1 ATP-grasp domain-containing protein [Rhodococcus sp. PAMC28707]